MLAVVLRVSGLAVFMLYFFLFRPTVLPVNTLLYVRQQT
jgi:hypothetical protein